MTLTKTFACRRSRVTSTPVTVTKLVMRGSFASSARKVATTSRMAAATRSPRRCSVAMAGSGGRGRRERARDLFGAIALDDVAHLDVVEVLDRDTALEAFAHLANVILEPLERRDGAVEHFDPFANDAHPTLSIDDAAPHRTTGDRSDPRNLEYLAHLGFAEDDFALFGPEHSFHRRADVGHRFVDDAVQLDVDAFAFRRGARVVVRAHVEADDDRARRLREQNVALGDCADTAMHDVDVDFGGRQSGQCVGQRFGRAALIGLDENVERVHAAGGGLRHEVLERHAAASSTTASGFAIETLAPMRHFARG